MGASLFRENEPRPSRALDCVHRRDGRWEWTLISSSDPSVNGFYLSTHPFLSFGSLHLFLEIAIIKSSYGGALFSQILPVRQYVRAGGACHLFPRWWLDSPACWVVPLRASLFAERLTLPSELTHANNPKSLATKSLLVKES